MRKHWKLLCIIGLYSLFVDVHAQQINVNSLSYSTIENQNRLQFDVSANSKYHVFTLNNPSRLVIDFQNAQLGEQALSQPPASHPLFANVRYARKNNGLRVVLDFKSSIDTKNFTLISNSDDEHSLVVSLLSKNTVLPSASISNPPPVNEAATQKTDYSNTVANQSPVPATADEIKTMVDKESKTLSVINESVTKKQVLKTQSHYNPVVLSHAENLETAWKIALENNHQIKAAEANTTSSEQQLESVRGLRLPELNVNTGYTQYNQSPAAIAHINNGETAQFATAQAGSAKAQAIVTIPVYSSGRIDHSIASAQSTLEATQQQQATTELSLKMQVAEAYIGVLRAESAVKVADSHIESLAADSKDVKDRFEQGIVANNDVLAADVALANAEQQQIKVKLQLDNAKTRYNQLLNRHLTDDVSLDSHLPDMLSGTLEELTNNALKQRPELTVLNAQIDALKQQADSVNANLLPQVAINGGYQYQQNRYQAHEGLWVASINMDWKLFDGSTGYKSDALMSKALALKEQYDDLSSQLAMQVRQAWLEIEETRKRLATAEKTIALADENLKVATDRYQQGLTIHTEVLAAENSRLTSHDNLHNAQYDMALARLRLRYAVGVL